MENLSDVLTIEKFKQWLIDNKDEFVGFPNDMMQCPIANYLNDTIHNSYESFSVDDSIIEDLYNEELHDTPEWVERFIRNLDNLTESGKQVRGMNALRILNS